MSTSQDKTEAVMKSGLEEMKAGPEEMKAKVSPS
jgi:hypothetical protein